MNEKQWSAVTHRADRIFILNASFINRHWRLGGVLERVMGVEPTSKAWEAFILPMNYTRRYNWFSLQFITIELVLR